MHGRLNIFYRLETKPFKKRKVILAIVLPNFLVSGGLYEPAYSSPATCGFIHKWLYQCQMPFLSGTVTV